MKRKFNFGFLALSLSALAFTACTSGTDNGNNAGGADSLNADTAGAIQVVPVEDSKSFPGATLEIASLTAEKAGADSAKITVKYNVQNFTLTEHTEDSNAHHMANSHEGQHIHFILNEEPYVALYSPEHSFTVALGSEHTVLSFLSRSFHESIKSAAAYQLVKFRVNDNGSLEQLPVTEEAALFYSRPKGDYEGTDTTAVLLDFYIVNTTLSGEGNQVKAHINDQEFLLNQWTPYEILNLSPGENTIRLTLVDKDGNTLSGDHVSVEGKMRINR